MASTGSHPLWLLTGMAPNGQQHRRLETARSVRAGNYLPAFLLASMQHVGGVPLPIATHSSSFRHSTPLLPSHPSVSAGISSGASPSFVGYSNATHTFANTFMKFSYLPVSTCHLFLPVIDTQEALSKHSPSYHTYADFDGDVSCWKSPSFAEILPGALGVSLAVVVLSLIRV